MTDYTDTLQSGSTRLCRCFRLERLDGFVMGFTDHDDDVTFGGLTYAAGAALTASEASSSLGLAPDELDAGGALSADAITEIDLAAGLYDGAEVKVYDVDWSSPSTRGLLGRYTIGQVERGALAFNAELRSLAASLDRAEGRIHTTLCDVRRVGDDRCGVSLSGLQGTGTITSTDGLEVVASGLSGFAKSTFNRGILKWQTGTNAGLELDIRSTSKSNGLTTISLWTKPDRVPALGDTFTVTAGCDRTAATCKSKFSNLTNFRGFPHMPGDAFITEFGVEGDPDQDGGSRFE